MVSKLEEAKHIVAAMKYFPEDRRGVALPPLHRYAPQPMPEAVKSANRDLALFLQIENNEGVENAAALAALDAVDLSVDWPRRPELVARRTWAIGWRRLEAGRAEGHAAARGQNKSLGRLVQDVESGVAAHRLGYDFLAYSNDLKVWEAGLAAGVKGLTERLQPGRA